MVPCTIYKTKKIIPTMKLPQSPIFTQLHRWSNKPKILLFEALKKVNQSKHDDFNPDHWLTRLLSSSNKQDLFSSTRIPKDFMLDITAARTPDMTNEPFSATPRLPLVLLELTKCQQNPLTAHPKKMYMECHGARLKGFASSLEKPDKKKRKSRKVSELFIGRHTKVDYVYWYEKDIEKKLKLRAKESLELDYQDRGSIVVNFQDKPDLFEVKDKEIVVNWSMENAEELKREIQEVGEKTSYGILLHRKGDIYSFMKYLVKLMYYNK